MHMIKRTWKFKTQQLKAVECYYFSWRTSPQSKFKNVDFDFLNMIALTRKKILLLNSFVLNQEAKRI